MAIIKVVKKSGKSKIALKKVLSYVGSKACQTFGINCDENYQKVAREFLDTKDYYNKNEGRQYRHYIQSFKPGEITEDKIMEISKRWAEKAFPGHEVFIAVHNDRDHLHTHFIVNTVSFETGKKLHEKKNDLDEKKRLCNEICQEYGLAKPNYKTEKGDVIAYEKEKYQIIKKGADITRLAETIIEQIKTATSVKSFVLGMKEKGYETEWKDNKKNVVFTVDPAILEGKKNKFRLSNLMKTFSIPDFDKDRLLEIFKFNLEKTQKVEKPGIEAKEENKKEDPWSRKKESKDLGLWR